MCCAFHIAVQIYVSVSCSQEGLLNVLMNVKRAPNPVELFVRTKIAAVSPHVEGTPDVRR